GGAPPVLTGGDWTQALAAWARAALASGGEAHLHAQARATLDRTLLEVALELHQGHRQNAAAALGLGRNTLTRKLGASRRRQAKPEPTP
ncbi:Helix-turn-helix, Fis-type domain protein, partial [mine drainage metagenome]